MSNQAKNAGKALDILANATATPIDDFIEVIDSIFIIAAAEIEAGNFVIVEQLSLTPPHE